AKRLHRIRRTAAALGGLVVLLLATVAWALVERSNADREADRARAQALVAQSLNQLAIDPERSVALASQAWQVSHTPEAENALRRALSASLVRGRLNIGTTSQATVAGRGRAIVSEGPTGLTVWRGVHAR